MRPPRTLRSRRARLAVGEREVDLGAEGAHDGDRVAFVGIEGVGIELRAEADPEVGDDELGSEIESEIGAQHAQIIAFVVAGGIRIVGNRDAQVGEGEALARVAIAPRQSIAQVELDHLELVLPGDPEERDELVAGVLASNWFR